MLCSASGVSGSEFLIIRQFIYLCTHTWQTQTHLFSNVLLRLISSFCTQERAQVRDLEASQTISDICATEAQIDCVVANA